MQNAPGKAWNGMEDKECCDEKAYVTGSDAPCALFRKLNPRPTERPPFLGFRTLPVEIANACGLKECRIVSHELRSATELQISERPGS